jgi:hypothetical protein
MDPAQLWEACRVHGGSQMTEMTKTENNSINIDVELWKEWERQLAIREMLLCMIWYCLGLCTSLLIVMFWL